MSRLGDLRIGISGWRYPPWCGVFYPEDLAQRNELAFAARLFNSIEINGTFYSMQRPESFAAWAQATPEDFVFSLKGPRYITHLLRLKNARTPLANFFASGVLRLGAKLGPILWQFAPDFRFEPGRLEEFFALLPRDTETASALARRHDDKLKTRAWLKISANRRLRHAIEIRHDSFKTPDFIRLLRKFDVALVCADTVEWPRLMDVTSDFMYCRLHGSEVLYASGYDETAIDIWARRVIDWAQGREPSDGERIVAKPARKRAKRDVFVYFDNDAKVRAPFDAQLLCKRIEALLNDGAQRQPS
jgi:uncharacterized protein YecE (DUF72 family)